MPSFLSNAASWASACFNSLPAHSFKSICVVDVCEHDSALAGDVDGTFGAGVCAVIETAAKNKSTPTLTISESRFIHNSSCSRLLRVKTPRRFKFPISIFEFPPSRRFRLFDQLFLSDHNHNP